MKKNIFCLVAIAAISLGAWNYSENQSNVEISNLALANVEALAYGEDGSNLKSCYDGWDNGSDGYYFEYIDCWTCNLATATTLWNSNSCWWS